MPALPPDILTAEAEGQAGLAVIFLLGRLLFAALFVMSGANHLFNLRAAAEATASAGIPAPKSATVITGLVLLAGGLSILLGIAVGAGTLLLLLFLVTAALTVHRFWGLDDPAAAQNQLSHFLKNMSLAGAALMLHYFWSAEPGAWIHAAGR